MNDALFEIPEHEPRIRTSKSGYGFEVESMRWVIGKSCVLNWALLDPSIDREVRRGLRLTLARMAEEVSPSHARNCYSYVRNFFLDTANYTGGSISSVQILNCKATLALEDEYKLGTIRSLLRNWIDWEYPGLEKGLGKFLDSLKLRGNLKGRAVLHSCPHTGPWTITEQQMLLTWSANAFADNEIDLAEFAWFLICYQTGRRPSQISSLRIRDLEATKLGESQLFSINFPRAKKRGDEGGFRRSFRKLSVTEDLFLVLLNLADQVQDLARYHVSGLSEKELLELPIFLPPNAFAGINSERVFRRAMDAEPEIFHMANFQSNQLSKKLSQHCKAVSERTEDFIHFTPTRCRRTRATNLVRHGISGVQLAYLLDHEDTQQVGVYTEYSPELSLRIFEKMNEPMNFLAARFEGRIIARESDAIRGDDPASRRHKSGMKHVGNCGGSACDSGIKICVSCVRFQPLLTANWDELFIELSEELENRKAIGASDLVLQTYDVALVHVAAIMKACDRVDKSRAEVSV